MDILAPDTVRLWIGSQIKSFPTRGALVLGHNFQNGHTEAFSAPKNQPHIYEIL